MIRQVFCGALGATLAFFTTATTLADAWRRALVHCPSLLAAMNACRHMFETLDSSTGVNTIVSIPSEPMPTLNVAIEFQLIRSAESHSGRSGPFTGTLSHEENLNIWSRQISRIRFQSELCPFYTLLPRCNLCDSIYTERRV